jgi:hypothetical protein
VYVFTGWLVAPATIYTAITSDRIHFFFYVESFPVLSVVVNKVDGPGLLRRESVRRPGLRVVVCSVVFVIKTHTAIDTSAARGVDSQGQ